MDTIEFPRPNPAVVVLIDPTMWGPPTPPSMIREMNSIISSALAYPKASTRNEREWAREIVTGTLPMLQSDTEWNAEIERTRSTEYEPYIDAALVGMAIGREEISRGWRSAPTQVNGRLRRWWHDKRARRIEKRALEVLAVASKKVDEGFFLTHYFAQLGYWQTHEELPSGSS